jgi:signal peptidase
MGLKKWTSLLIQLVVILLVVSLFIGALLGEPVLLSYVETGSMEPTLSAGDGFVVISMHADSSIEEGDVVVFESEQIQGGGLTTHRVTARTENGYITKGDANPFTDQDVGEPPVKRGQVVAKALQINGQVVVIPALGAAVEGTKSVLSTFQQMLAALVGLRSLLDARGLAYLFFVMTLMGYVVGAVQPNNSKRRQRVTSRVKGIDTRLVVGAFAALLVVGATAAMVAPAGTQEFGIVSAEFESERPDVIPKGESKSHRYVVGNGGVLPIVTFLEPASDGVDVEPRETAVPARSAVNASVTLHAPPETGYYRLYVTEHRYLAILPQSTIRALYELHPWAPIVVIDSMIAVPFYVLGVRLVGRGRVRRRSRESPESVFARVRLYLTKLY